MQKRLFWEYARLELSSVQKEKKSSMTCQFSGQIHGRLFIPLAVPIVAYASFVFDSLVVLVIAFAMPFGYTCFTIR